MEKKRLVLIKCLNFLCEYSSSKSLLAYQLGMYFICDLSRKDLEEEEVIWSFESLDQLADYCSIFLLRDGPSASSTHDAINRLQDVDFIVFEQIEPSFDEVQQGCRDKKQWTIMLPIQTHYEMYEGEVDFGEGVLAEHENK